MTQVFVSSPFLMQSVDEESIYTEDNHQEEYTADTESLGQWKETVGVLHSLPSPPFRR